MQGRLEAVVIHVATATTSLSDRTFASTVAPISLVQASESVLAETLQTFAQTLMEAFGERQEVFA